MECCEIIALMINKIAKNSQIIPVNILFNWAPCEIIAVVINKIAKNSQTFPINILII